MDMFLEDPIPIALGGLVVAVLAAVLVAQRGQMATILAVTTVLLITGCLLLVEHFVVTDVEQVENTLAQISADLKANNTEAVIAHLSPQDGALRHLARSQLNLYGVREAKVGSDLKVTLNQLTSPPSAVAEFTGRLDLATQRGETALRPVVLKFTMKFARIDDRWYVSGYEYRQ